MIDGDRCPHCGSEDYGPVNEGHEQCCMACGYDTQNGTTGVCPGGMHPLGGGRKAPARGMCCDGCYDRIPRDLPEHPRWRSTLRTNFALRQGLSPNYYEARIESKAIMAAMTEWLAEHPQETSNP